MKAVATILLLAIALSSVYATSDAEYQDAFTTYMHKFGKMYKSDEFFTRYNAYKNNFDFVQKHDAAARGFEVELNQFADMDIVEFSRIYLGTKQNMAHGKLHINKHNKHVSAGADNVTVDWRTKGYVTPIKNQGQCGSCWAFSTTGSTEGANFKAFNKLTSFSEQQLVDCSGSFGNGGCNGGLMDNAFKYIMKNGLTTEAAYPYTAETGTCQIKGKPIVGKVTSYTDVTSGSEKDLTSAISTVGPISVAIDASHTSFQLYKSGVYSEPACSTSQLDHGVLAVGYGTSTADYYIVKNSWGTVWGMSGYINMSRNKNNQCGISTAASYPIA